MDNGLATTTHGSQELPAQMALRHMIRGRGDVASFNDGPPTCYAQLSHHLALIRRPVARDDHGERIDVAGVEHTQQIGEPRLGCTRQGGHDGVLDDFAKVEHAVADQGCEGDVHRQLPLVRV